MARTKLAETEVQGQYSIILETNDERYIVRYGEQKDDYMDYHEAIDAYKDCVNHALECQLFGLV